MTRKRKKRAAARAKRRREPVELEQPVELPLPAKAWSEVVDSFREMLQLESKTARRQALRLMHALEREALATSIASASCWRLRAVVISPIVRR